MKQKSTNKPLVFLLFFCLCLRVNGQTISTDSYPDAPPVVLAAINLTAEDIVRNDDADRVSSQLPTLLFYTLADAVAKEGDRLAIRDLKAYEYLGETARTDKQIGVGARSGGTTSAVEKPGYADLLGFAIEHGAIQQNIDDTSLTLSTTPYAFFAWANDDSADTNRKYGWLRLANISANFNLSDNDAPPLTDARRSQLNEWSVKFRLNPDRSSRSAEFQKAWREKAKPAIVQRLKVITGAESALLTRNNGLNDLRKSLRDKLRANIRQSLDSHRNDPGRSDEITQGTLNDSMKKEVARIILNEMGDVFRKVRSGQIAISEETRKEITEVDIPALFAAHDQLELAREWVDEFVEILDRKPKVTLAYTYKRQEMGSNYSVAKLLYEQSFFKRPVKLVFNGGFSFYEDPNPMLNQETWRDFSTALSIEAKSNSPFLKGTPDLSKITYSLDGRYQRLRENRGMAMKKSDIGVVQFKVEMPIAAGVSIPLSISYATATEELNEKHTQGHFGFTFDLDKFAAVTKLFKR